MEAVQGVKGSRALSAKRSPLLLPYMLIRFDAEPSKEKSLVNSYIKKRFHEMYNAKVDTYLPYVLSACESNETVATLGFQPAGGKTPLFLEQYLNATIEVVTSQALNYPVRREYIVELGNLASSHKNLASRILFLLIVAILHQAGYKCVTFTATKQVRHLLNKLKLTTIAISEADPDKLPDGGESWGNYYDDKPKVVIGDLTNAMKQLSANNVINSMFKNYQKTIDDIANQIEI